MPHSLTGKPDTSDLFLPAQLGPYTLANRIVMAPLTRSRATEDGVPVPLMAQYYAQRASAGLIIAEATNISPQGRGYAFTPGLYTPQQVEAWQPVTRAVHDKGGRIFVQLWHVGRISHPSLQPGAGLPVAPSAILPRGKAFTASGYQPLVTPRALNPGEITGIVSQYRAAAANALAAGFDGVEIHAANGYLIEQFLREATNRRTDDYGGTLEKRARFLLEVTAAVVDACGADRVGIRLSPMGQANDSTPDTDSRSTYLHVVERLNPFGLAYLHVILGTAQGPRHVPGEFELQDLRRKFQGPYMANNGYDRERAILDRRYNQADFIAFGRAFISNPDLVDRLRIGARLSPADHQTFFGGGAAGYTDYPCMSEADRIAA